MKKVLIIDDDQHVLILAEKLLKREGYEIIKVDSPDNAITIVKEELPDIILCDIRMPFGEEGFKVIRKIKKHTLLKEIPILIFSQYEETTNITKAFKIGAVDFVRKNYHEQELVARIKVHLDLRQARLDLEKRNHQLFTAKNNLEKANKELTLEIQKRNKKSISLEKLDNIIKDVFNQYNENGLEDIIKDEAFELLSNNKYQELFSSLKAKSQNDRVSLKIIILLESNYNQTKSSFIVGIISNSEHKEEMAKLNNGLYDIIEMVFQP